MIDWMFTQMSTLSFLYLVGYLQACRQKIQFLSYTTTNRRLKMLNNSFTQRLKDSYSDPSHKPIIILEASSWFKENQGLHDYQAHSKLMAVERFCIDRNCKIYRHSTTAKVSVVYQETLESTSVDNIYIASVVYDYELGEYRVQSADVSGVRPHHFIAQETPDLFRNSYLVVDDFSKDGVHYGYQLQVGNYVKLGVSEFCVIELRDELGVRISKETAHLERNKGVHVVGEVVRGTCKFCLGDENSAEDPLITPCACKGSCAAVHVECVKNWTNSKVRKEAGKLALTYNFSKFECEICKALLPKAVRLADHSEVRMLEYQKPDRPYIILESLPDKKEERDRIVHILYPAEKNSVKMGRGRSCSVSIQEITVSRTHSQISFIDGRFYISDLKSKFGTLVKFREQLVVKDKVRLQSGRTVLSFSVKNEKMNYGMWKRKEHKYKGGQKLLSS